MVGRAVVAELEPDAERRWRRARDEIGLRSERDWIQIGDEMRRDWGPEVREVAGGAREPEEVWRRAR
eukprot:4062869-Pleurochrysis_carterae.AAC.1